MSFAVKVTSETPDAYTVGGYGALWGGRDLAGEHFEADTDFWLDRLGPPPVLYQHGQDSAAGKAVLGRVTAHKADDMGLWIEAQIQRSNEYAAALEKLIKAGRMGWSSGAISHLVEVANGRIKTWPVAEFSLTPEPAEPRTLGVAPLTKSIWDLTNELVTAPLALEAEALDVEARARALVERTQDLHQRRLKEGRMLSGANREAIRTCMEAMNGAMEALSALLAASEPVAKAADADALERERERRARQALLFTAA
jgi:hypothetical protein